MVICIDFSRRIVVVGHYGSGKTEFALNLAYKLKAEGKKVTIVDMDIVNPYFRTKDDEDELVKAGIKVIVSKYANTNVDVPALPPEIYAAFETDGYVIFDVGGNDDGAIVLGRFKHYFDSAPYDMLGVVNLCRPLTSNADEIAQSLMDIQNVSRLKFTGIVNNTNLSYETKAHDIKNSIAEVECAAEKLGCEVKYISLKNELAGELSEYKNKLFPMEIRLKKW